MPQQTNVSSECSLTSTTPQRNSKEERKNSSLNDISFRRCGCYFSFKCLLESYNINERINFNLAVEQTEYGSWWSMQWKIIIIKVRYITDNVRQRERETPIKCIDSNCVEIFWSTVLWHGLWYSIRIDCGRIAAAQTWARHLVIALGNWPLWFDVYSWYVPSGKQEIILSIHGGSVTIENVTESR